jgi:8-oxo-dGTP diphosphatase
LAFDHKEIVRSAYQAVKDLTRQEPIWHEVLPKKFTLTQLQEFYETVLNKPLDKGNFRKKVQTMKFVKALNESQKNVKHRPSALYSFDAKAFREYRETDTLIEF